MANETDTTSGESQQLVEVKESRIKELAAFEVARDAKALVTSWAKWIVGTVTVCFALLGFKTYRDIHITIQEKTNAQIAKADLRIENAIKAFEKKSEDAILGLENEVKDVKRRADNAKQYLALMVTPKLKSIASPDEEAENKPLMLGPGTSISVSSGAATSIGTICCVVQDAKDSKYIIVPNYVAEHRGGEAFAGTSNRKIGVVVETTRAASLIKLKKGLTISIGPPNSPPFEGIGTVDRGDHVFGYGFKSGKLKGEVRGRVARAGFDDGESYTDVSILTSIVVAQGDGGAPVTNSKNQLVGMVYSGSTDTAQVIPIEKILFDLNVTLFVGN